MRLDHDERHVIDAFERGEAMRTAEALPSTTDGRVLLGDARIDHLGVVGVAGRAPHAVHVTCSRLAIGERSGAERRPRLDGERARTAECPGQGSHTA